MVYYFRVDPKSEYWSFNFSKQVRLHPKFTLYFFLLSRSRELVNALRKASWVNEIDLNVMLDIPRDTFNELFVVMSSVYP